MYYTYINILISFYIHMYKIFLRRQKARNVYFCGAVRDVSVRYTHFTLCFRDITGPLGQYVSQ